jgi:hypothetical protein
MSIYTLKWSEKRTCANINKIHLWSSGTAEKVQIEKKRTRVRINHCFLFEIHFYVKSIQENNAAQQLRWKIKQKITGYIFDVVVFLFFCATGRENNDNNNKSYIVYETQTKKRRTLGLNVPDIRKDIH